MKKQILVLAAILIVITTVLSSCKVTETRCPAYSKNTNHTYSDKRG